VIGTVRSIEKREGDLFQLAELDPEVDFSKLEEVLVITVPRAIDPEARLGGEPSSRPSTSP
jgi:cell shape-determining protein MreC